MTAQPDDFPIHSSHDAITDADRYAEGVEALPAQAAEANKLSDDLKLTVDVPVDGEKVVVDLEDYRLKHLPDSPGEFYAIDNSKDDLSDEERIGRYKAMKAGIGKHKNAIIAGGAILTVLTGTAAILSVRDARPKKK